MAAEVHITEVPQDATLRRWFRPVLERGSTFAAPNLETSPFFLRTPQRELPLTVNETEWDNSWICSPWTHYISCAREEISRTTSPVAAKAADAFLRVIGAALHKVHFNRVVMVNNWLLSTNPWPAWNADDLPEVIEALVKQWPDHALVFRSLNAKESGPLISALTKHRARLIPSRQVWYYNADSETVAKSHEFRKDVRLLTRDDLELVPHEALAREDFPALAQLYDQLYLGKYSRHNPQYTVEWFRHLHGENLARFTALRTREGDFVGVEASCELNGVLTSPVVGYDLDLPRSLGLYRRLAVIPLLEARGRGLPLNLSAGVGRFKALRGGEATMEYLGVVDRHLPQRRRLPWRLIETLSTRFLAPYVREHRL